MIFIARGNGIEGRGKEKNVWGLFVKKIKKI